MSWAQLTNRPNNVSPAFHHTHTPHIATNPYPKHTHNRISTANNLYTVPPPKVSTTSSKRKHNDITYVVLDSGAFIGRQSFFNNFNQTARYYMTPAVNHEIRDKQSRKFLEHFPYEIIVKKPESQSLQFVSQFIAKHPTLKSMSKVDRHIIALAHTLEIEHEGTKHVSTFKKKDKKGQKALSVVGTDGEKDSKTNKPHVKKSKTGRVHTQVVPLSDTGVRLSKLKKVIPFHFDEFMTLTKQQYGEQYGKPTSVEHHAALIMDVKSDKKTDEREEKIAYNPNVKASSECNVNDTRSSVNNEDSSSHTNNNDTNAISKAQRRRKRKKMNKNMKSSGSKKENSMELDDAPALGAEKSEIEKMIEEDLNTTFNESASLISSLSAHSNRQNIMPPSMNTEAHSQPIHYNGHNVAFGTMFNGAHGSLFGGTQAHTHGAPPPAPLSQTKPPKKKTIADAWDGEWLTPQNFKAIPKNANIKKKKLKNSEESTNKDSSVAVITVDKAMQRCMVEMGLRVMTTTSERQYGGGGQGQARRGHNGEPIDYIFRCYGCFQFEHNTTRTNCRWCGGQTFQRVAIYQDEKGKHHYRYFYRDRYGHRYLDKHQLVPRGSQLVKYQQNNHHQTMNQHRNQKKKKKKRGAIYNNNQYRGSGQRW